MNEGEWLTRLEPDFWAMVGMLLFNSLVCVGVHVSSRKWDSSMGARPLLSAWGDAVRRMPAFVAKPMCECLTCMASYWGIPVFLMVYPLAWSYVGLCAFYVFALAGLNSIVYNRVL